MNNLPRFTRWLTAGMALLVIASVAAAPPERPAETPGTPIDELRQARRQLAKILPFRSEIRETITIGGRAFHATGHYAQGTDLRLKLSFDVQVGGTRGSFLQVCDGQTLWTRHAVGKTVNVTSRDVQKILKALKAQPAVGGKKPDPTMITAILGLGGLEALLASLEESMTFDVRREQELIDEAGKPVRYVVIEGTWKARNRQMLAEGSGDPSGRLPDYIPDRARVYIDQTTRFPHRILYLKRHPERRSYRPLVTLVFHNVRRNDGSLLSEDAFRYTARKNEFAQDVTDAFLRGLRQAGQSPAPAGGSGSSARSR